jgi:uncharacterized protein (TIGR03545 family)
MNKIIRIKGLLIWVAVVALIAAFLLIFLDVILKKTFISTSETINRAKVELNTLETGLMDTSVRLDGLEWSDREKPMRNLFAFDTATFDLDAGPLLRKRLTIDTVSVDGLRFDTERKTSGAISKYEKKDKSENKEEKPDTGKKLLANLSIDVSKVIDIEKIPAVQEARRMKNLAEKKTEEWNQRIKKAADTQELQANYETIRKIDVNAYKFPADLIKAKNDAETVQKFIKQVQAKKEEADSLVKNFEAEQQNIRNEYANLKKMSQKAPKELLMSADSSPIDSRAIMEELVGKKMTETVTTAVALYRKYHHMIPMPEKNGDKPETVKRVAEKGTNVYFKTPGETPRVYIKNMHLNGQMKNGDVLTGDIKNLSTDISFKPYELALNLAKGADGRTFFTLDGQVGVVEDSLSTYLRITAAGYPVAEIIKPEENNYLKGVSGNLNIQGQIKGTGESFKLDMRLTSSSMGMEINSDGMDKTLAGLLSSALGRVEDFTADLSAEGKLDDFSVAISTNLQDIISRNVKGYVNEQLKKVNDEIQKRYAAELNKVFSSSDGIIGGMALNDSSRNSLKELASLNTGAAEKNDLIKKAISGQSGSGALDKLKGKLPF